LREKLVSRRGTIVFMLVRLSDSLWKVPRVLEL